MKAVTQAKAAKQTKAVTQTKATEQSKETKQTKAVKQTKAINRANVAECQAERRAIRRVARRAEAIIAERSAKTEPKRTAEKSLFRLYAS